MTHDIEGALSICDRIGLLEGGKLRFIGPPAEFRRSDEPLVRAFADRQAAALTAMRSERRSPKGRRPADLQSTGRP